MKESKIKKKYIKIAGVLFVIETIFVILSQQINLQNKVFYHIVTIPMTFLVLTLIFASFVHIIKRNLLGSILGVLTGILIGIFAFGLPFGYISLLYFGLWCYFGSCFGDYGIIYAIINNIVILVLIFTILGGYIQSKIKQK